MVDREYQILSFLPAPGKRNWSRTGKAGEEGVPFPQGCAPIRSETKEFTRQAGLLAYGS